MDVITFDQWFENSEEICSYLTQQYDDWMLYYLVEVESTDSSKQCKGAIAIMGWMVGDLFVYEPNSKNGLIRQYPCLLQKLPSPRISKLPQH